MTSDRVVSQEARGHSPEHHMPAFPTWGEAGDHIASGMSLRDYFAVHSTQPGMSEIAKAAGVGMDSSRRVYLEADAPFGRHFDEWWGALSLQQQCDLSARVRYAQADAMLRVRAEPAQQGRVQAAEASGTNVPTGTKREDA